MGQGSAPRSRLLRVSGFEPAYLPDDPSAKAELRRRYSVLFADESTRRRGGLGSVCLVTNAYGEKLALKSLLPQGAPNDTPGPAVDDVRLAAFRAEYDAQRSLAGLPCVPSPCGWGMVEGLPVILMEWVEGVTLGAARAELAIDDEGRVSPLVAAALGRDLFSALADLSAEGVPVVHRDVSPANVMVRTSQRTVAQQADDGAFDLCLIDFGSAVAPVCAADARAGSLTQAGALVRWATPDYAPPEMLTDDVPGVADLRGSAAIDVYAAASVVFDLACARPPFGQRGERGLPSGLGASPYRTKMDCTPAPVVMAHAETACLDAVLAREPAVAEALAGLPWTCRRPLPQATAPMRSRRSTTRWPPRFCPAWRQASRTAPSPPKSATASPSWLPATARTSAMPCGRSRWSPAGRGLPAVTMPVMPCLWPRPWLPAAPCAWWRSRARLP
ncbi:MAG: protein kinase domain-containing protein [Paratractidigestivibacter faecalis]